MERQNVKKPIVIMAWKQKMAMVFFTFLQADTVHDVHVGDSLES